MNGVGTDEAAIYRAVGQVRSQEDWGDAAAPARIRVGCLRVPVLLPHPGSHPAAPSGRL